MSSKPNRCVRNLLALLPFLLLTGCAEQDVPEKQLVRPVRAMKVADVAGVTGRSFPGRAKATQEVDLSFRVAGRLVSFPAEVGDAFQAGDLVAKLDPRDFEVNLRNAQAQLQSAKAAFQRAQSDYRRQLSIQKEDPGATSQAAIDRARAQRDQAKAESASFQASVEAAKDQLTYTSLLAPFTGAVVATYVENFEDVRAKEAVLRLLDSSRIEMIVNIPESLISLTPYVNQVYVVFDAFPKRELVAQIKEVGTEASRTTRTYPVTLIMDQPEDIKILPGMAGRTVRSDAKLPDDVRETGVEVPVSATFSPEEGGKTYVWVIDEGTMTVKRREVTTGKLKSTGILVTEGLQPGEWIAVAGVHLLREGQQVRFWSEQGS